MKGIFVFSEALIEGPQQYYQRKAKVTELHSDFFEGTEIVRHSSAIEGSGERSKHCVVGWQCGSNVYMTMRGIHVEWGWG